MRNPALFHALSGAGEMILVEKTVTLELGRWPCGEDVHGQGGLGIVSHEVVRWQGTLAWL